MAYFVRIGGIHTNKSGVGARGYELLRRGRVIQVRWGAVKVLPGARFVWVWNPPQKRSWSFRSEAIAKLEYEKRLKERKKNRYSKLPNGARILVAK